jgi:hypothetical protein
MPTWMRQNSTDLSEVKPESRRSPSKNVPEPAPSRKTFMMDPDAPPPDPAEPVPVPDPVPEEPEPRTTFFPAGAEALVFSPEVTGDGCRPRRTIGANEIGKAVSG